MRCLSKETKQRWQAVGDIRFELEHAGAESPASSAGAGAQSRRAMSLAWTSTAAATMIAAVFAIPAVRHLRETSLAEMRLEITTPSTPAPLEFALSPDGRSIVFVASGNGPEQRLWVRALDKTDTRPMPGTEGAQRPFWSPDARSIGFFALGKLYRVDVIGGPPQVVANAPNVACCGGTWNADGTILFAPTNVSPIMRVGIAVGEPVAVTQLDPPRQTAHAAPQFLPDGRHFLFYAQGTRDSLGIYLGSLDGGQAKRLVDADTAGMYLPPDYVIFARQGQLMAQRLNLVRRELTGDPVIITNPVGYSANLAGFSVSRDGRIAYRADGAGSAKQLVWFDGTGKTLGSVGEPVPVTDGQFYAALSPDERRIAISETVQDNMDLWLLDVGRSGKTRLTFNPAADQGPMWSPDGRWIAFSSNRKGVFNLYLKASSGAGNEELLLETPNNKGPVQWSKDGQFLLYVELNPKTGRDLWVIPMRAKERRPRVVVNTPFEERNGQFSPDGRWLAYETNESGIFQIVVQPFPEPSGKWQVSANGGVQPRWRGDGKELYFIAPDGKLMSASVTAGRSSFEAGTPVALFQTRIAGGTAATFRPQYSVTRDGRFLINQLLETSTPPITLILNWRPKP